MNGTLQITLRYRTRNGKEVISHDSFVDRKDLDSIASAHRDPVSLVFDVADESLRRATDGYTK